MAINWTIETHDSVHSTQDIIKGMADFGESEGRVVQSLEQTGGRGRHGRQWVSEKGNLYLSMLLRPTCHITHVGQLAMVIAVSLADTIKSRLKNPDDLNLKWPNDILIKDQKCAGILIETALAEGAVALSYAAAGVGVDIVSAPKQIATALNDHAVKPVDLKEFRDLFLKNFAADYVAWNRNGFADIKARWLTMGHKKGTNLRVKIDTQVEQGIFYGIDNDGNLLLHDRELRQKKVTAGEVYLI